MQLTGFLLAHAYKYHVCHAVDLTHGTQGVVSKLSSTIHGPGGGRKQLPVVDLTGHVPFRTACRRQGLAGSPNKSGSCGNAASGLMDQNITQVVVPLGMASSVSSFMTSVHAVSEVLHVLAEFQPAMSQALFHDLIE